MPGAPSLRVLCARVGFQGPIPLGIFPPLLLQNLFPVNHRRNENVIHLQSINNPILVDDKFANVLVVELRDLTARTRKLLQGARLANDFLQNIPA